MKKSKIAPSLPSSHRRLALLSVILTATLLIPATSIADDYYTEEPVFSLRPKPESTKDLGHIGPTGILAFVEQGVKVTIQGTRENSPASGKFQPGEVILAVNGAELLGKNPFVVLGNAITAAEANDGAMTFDVEAKDGTKRQVAITIPVLGAYSPTWPVDCPKSQKIISDAAKFYSQYVTASDDKGVPTALACLFLLSTGDDAHLPVVRQHYLKFANNPKAIGDHTWNNGYNGIACAEYYLRTGDKDVLPVLQAICDDARDRQNFNSAWKHWGSDINPGYVAGGLMNPASTQVLTTLLLCKEAGVNVDEKTLENCLRYFWRFVGRGSVPYGDHRGEGGVGSNGKDAMIAAAMQVATGASGDTSIYASARDCQALATLNAYPDMIMGHADNGRGDGIWRGIASTYLMEKKPAQFREVMDRLTWWYDLSRFDDGAMGLATCTNFNDPASGAGAAMLYTAPLKKLRITGAPRSPHATEFQLPARIWGNDADLAFHNIEPAAGYQNHGEILPIHRIIPLIGSAYAKGVVLTDPAGVSLEQLRQFVRHPGYMIRTQAAKALRIKSEWSEIETLLRDPDPRLRRAALDGIIDWNYFFATGKTPIKPEQFTPAMIESITAMLNNPDESTYVVEGALFAISFMPTEAIQKNIAAILPWTTHSDWWFRHASFMALHGLHRDPALYATVVPKLIEIMVAENHTMPRAGMNKALADSLKKFGPDSPIGQLIANGFNQGIAETRILEGNRAREGKYNITDAIGSAVASAPDTAPQLAAVLVARGLSLLDNDELLQMTSGGRGFAGFLKVCQNLKGPAREALENTLLESFRPELAKRLKAGGGTDIPTIDALLGIIQLRNPNAGWQSIGTPAYTERQWRFTSFDPIAEKDMLPLREGRRYRAVELPDNLQDWFKPEFDDTAWQQGLAPIGKGGHPRANKSIVNRSDWGPGEILLARTTFELSDTDFDLYRVRVMCLQGYTIYLNGRPIQTYTWWHAPSEFAIWPMGRREAGLLKKGTNTLAIYTMAYYPSAAKPHWKEEVFGQVDLHIEGLRTSDLH
jgi:hypothetical protein